MRIRSLVVPAALSLVWMTAAPAGAAVSVSVFGTSGQVWSDGANDNIVVRCDGGNLHADGAPATAGPCATLTVLYVNGGGGKDTVGLGAVTPAAFPVLGSIEAYLDDGEGDTFNGSPLRDNVEADTGDLVYTGDGADRVKGGQLVDTGAGDDVIEEYFSGLGLRAGAGDDRVVQSTGDAMDGGPGIDSWEVDFDRAGVVAPGTFTMTATGTAIVFAAPEISASIPLTQFEIIDATLLTTGTQVWDGSAFTGVQEIAGLDGVDALTGGPGEDRLAGGGANDTVTGGGGADVLLGGGGDDVVNARDGGADRVDCGGGADRVVADAADLLVGCESVDLPAPDTGAIKGPKKVDKPATASFKVSSPTPGATFQCQVDKSAWKACASPVKVKTQRLKPGKHTLTVRAVAAGVVDPTPSVRKFKVLR